MKKVFIDGSAGTTGLRIRQRLGARSDLELIEIEESVRKDPAARSACLNAADIVFLCLPDAAAVEAAAMVQNPDTVIIDTSTAHRVDSAWAYGFPELPGLRDQLRGAKRIANPGCHASGFLALVTPLVACGLLSRDAALSCFSLTGYSGGGKKMIAQYEAPDADPLLEAPRQYGLSQAHKHLPEMQKISGLTVAPAFCPVVAPYYAGMEVTVPVFAGDLHGTPEDIRAVYRACYSGGLVRYCEATDENGYLSAGVLAGCDQMQITVFGNAERILLVSRFDNLGKGASGAAIQNMNLVLGLEETTGLHLLEGSI